MSPAPGNNQFDDEFRKRLEDASIQPPSGIWEKIERKLPETVPFYFRFKYPIAAAILTFTVMSSLIIYNRYERSIDKEHFNTKIHASHQDNTSFNSSSSNLPTSLNYLSQQNLQENLEPVNNSSNTPSNNISSSDNSFSKSTVATSVKVFEGASYSTTPNTDNSNESVSPKGVNNSKKKIGAKKNPISISREMENIKSEPIVGEIQQGISNSNNLIDEHVLEENSLLAKNEESIQKLDVLTTKLFQDDENPELENKLNKGKSKSIKNKFASKGLVLGPVLGAHFTAMTKQSEEGMNTSKMEQTSTFGKSYGLNIGYIINHHWSVGMEWIYNSDEGQNFKEKIKGQIVEKSIVLDYMKIPFYFKYTQKFITRYDKCPITLNLVGGIHYSKLKTVNTYVDHQIAPLGVNYNEHEWGMLGGVEFDIFPTNRIFFTVGSRVTFNADLEKFPSLRGNKGSDPFSVQAGVYAKINYVFSFKKKN